MDRQSLAALRRVLDLPLVVALAFGCALLVILGLVAGAGLMPVSLARIVSVQRHLASGAGPSGGVAVLGSSVVLEGVDCAELTTRVACENLAWTGGNARQWLLLEPALRKSAPRVLVLGLDLFTLLAPDAIPRDRLTVAGWWEFVPAAELFGLRGVLSAEELAALEAPRLVQLLGLRSFPLNAMNERVREVARSDLRYEGYVTNFTAPWIRRSPAAENAMQMHLEQTLRVIQRGGTHRLADSERELAALVERARAGSPEMRFLFVLTPVHPRLAETLGGDVLASVRGSVSALSTRLAASFADDTLALAGAGFSDAVHPFGEGRLAWSHRLGEATAPLLTN
jgi:hypothetical protein